MALVGRVLSVAKRGLRNRPQIVLIPRRSRRLFCCEPSSSHPLLIKLLQVPYYQIKQFLDSDYSLALNDCPFPWDALVPGLLSSSSENARLVLEWKLDKMLKENERDLDQYLNLMSLCGKTQNVSLAMRVFTSMEANGIAPTPSVFNSLIHACLSSGDSTTAFSLFEIMQCSEGYKPNAETYETLISGFSRLGNADTMQTWYSAARAAGYSATLQTYESLISGCVKSRDFDAADKFCKNMIQEGLMPNTTILENVIDGLSKRRRFDKIKQFIKYLLDGGWEISESMAEKVTGFYCKHGKVEELEELLETLMEYCQVSEVLLQVHCGIIRMYAMSNRLDEVEYSVGRMLKQGLSFKSRDDVEKVICSYFRQEAYDRLDLFLERIKSCYKLTRPTYDLLVAGYRRAGLFEKLDLVINDMKLAGCL